MISAGRATVAAFFAIALLGVHVDEVAGDSAARSQTNAARTQANHKGAVLHRDRRAGRRLVGEVFHSAARCSNSVPVEIRLVWLVSFRACQQFFFQPSPARPELLDLRLESVEELDDLAVLATKRVEAYVSRH
jgi:hypothetical protein